MVKQYLAAVLEDLVGEYVLNISKENLKLATLKGEIKLDNVELDGDYIGSHVLGAVGLQGFGVLSCYAKSLKIHFPWKNLDEPTSLEIHGMHLVCVPLLPTTATRMYYCGGISGGSLTSQTKFHDVTPRCSLRTRAKRSAIARFERSFFSGRIPGEGPQLEKEESDSKTLNFNGRRNRWSISIKDDENISSFNDDIESMNAFPSTGTINESEHSDTSSTTTTKQTLKEKITSKIYQNLISSINDVHIRFEVPEGALDMSLTARRDSAAKKGRDENKQERSLISDQKAFAFGLILERLSVQNVVEDVHRHETTNFKDKCCKTIEISNMSIYWDDGPSFLLTESDSIKGLLPVPVERLQKQIAEVMKQMSVRQDPTEDLRQKLNSLNSPSRAPFDRKKSKTSDYRAHEYICTNLSQTIHTVYSTKMSGSTSYFVDILSSKIDIYATSQQFRQYQLLKNAVLSQQRYDTMLHGRPKKSPKRDPRSWWKYAILCVKHRPNSRPWSDIQQIIRCRKKYIDLVVKNLESETEQSGFHGGLSWVESLALLEIENLLPIESLLAFHLLALRRVYDRRCVQKKAKSTSAKLASRKKKRNSLSRLWHSINGELKTSSSRRSIDDFVSDSPALPIFPLQLAETSDRSIALRQRESKISDSFYDVNDLCREPSHETMYHLQRTEIQIILLKFPGRTKVVALEVALRGNSFNSGDGNEKYKCDILQFQAFDFVTNAALKSKVLSVEPSSDIFTNHFEEETIIEDENTRDASKLAQLPLRTLSSISSIDDSLLNLVEENEQTLPVGVVCRVTATANDDDIALALTAHPATIIWANACADAVADFFYTSTPDVKIQFLKQLRSAATPGAHKRQLELLYPTSLSITIDVDAPKMWIPVSLNASDGALFIDAGKLKMAVVKPSKTSSTRWGIDLSDIQIKFSREDTSTQQFDISLDLDAVNSLNKEFIIVRPFYIGMSGIMTESVEIPLKVVFPSDSISAAAEISIVVGKVSLNLVDVEELAKALGRFYAAQIIRLKAKPELKEPLHDTCLPIQPKQAVSLPFEISLSIEKLEVALESYANNAGKNIVPNRTYLLIVSHTKLSQRSSGLRHFSRLAISDISIVQLKETKRGGVRILKPSDEPQHQIMGKNRDIEQNDIHKDDELAPPLTPTTKSTHIPPCTPKELSRNFSRQKDTTGSTSSFISACHFHDGENHIDEIEFDIADVIVRITPTSIVDLKKAFTRLFELIKLTSTEMERKVHTGRRDKDRLFNSKTTFHSLEATEHSTNEKQNKLYANDSSIIYRVSFKRAVIFVGRPASEFTSSRTPRRHGTVPKDNILEIITNASILIQSIENPDETGSKTAHVSLNNLFASVSNTWIDTGTSDHVIIPTEVDFRAVYKTVEQGLIVSQDFSFDCETLKCCLLPHDFNVILTISRKVMENLNALQTPNRSAEGFPPVIIYRNEKGFGIATNIRFELNNFSLVLLHNNKRPFVDFTVYQLKLRLIGVASCLSGEMTSEIKLSLYNPMIGWEHVVEPFRMHLDITLIPDEQIFNMKSADMININCTSCLLQELSSVNRSRKHIDMKSDSLQKMGSIQLINDTGIDFNICLSNHSDHDTTELFERLIKVGDSVAMDSLFPDLIDNAPCEATISTEGRKSISKLPLNLTPERSIFLYKWPVNTISFEVDNDLEPVVESIMENQRLKSDVVDIFTIDRGVDLLSSTVWSPEFISADFRDTMCMWQKPYLNGDVPEFSDMTCTIKKSKDSSNLPGTGWMWVDDWKVEIGDKMGFENDSDGWCYEVDFDTFSGTRRFYKRGDLCRRRRWTRHRVFKQTAVERAYRLVWEVCKKENESLTIIARSHISIKNKTSMPLIYFGYCASLGSDYTIGSALLNSSINVPIQLAHLTHLRLGVPKEALDLLDTSTLSITDCFTSDRVMILPSSLHSSKIIRTTVVCDMKKTDMHEPKLPRNLHFLLRLRTSIDGVCSIDIEPAFIFVNLLPCEIQCQFAESFESLAGGKQVVQTEMKSISSGQEEKILSLDCRRQPNVSIRLPGYKWSSWNVIVNRHINSQTWMPSHLEENTLFNPKNDDVKCVNEYRTIVHLDNKCTGAFGLNLIMSVEVGHSPTIRIYAQYWILDKSGFGLRFTDNFDIIGQEPDQYTLRSSFLTSKNTNTTALASDTKRQGCEWSIGMNGMTLFFSEKERVSFSVVHDEDVLSLQKQKSVSRWSTFIDISNAISTTIISVDDTAGKKGFELAYDVTLCPSIFSRTLMISFFPRYQIANLLQQNLFIKQDSGESKVLIPSNTCLPFHWEDSSLPHTIRLSCQIENEPKLWTQGCISLDEIGITAIRLPSSKNDSIVVVQVEVRLATKKQSSAVTVVIWSSIEESNTLYSIRNNSAHTIFCSQPLMYASNEDTEISLPEWVSNNNAVDIDKLRLKEISSLSQKASEQRRDSSSNRHKSIYKTILEEFFHGKCTGSKLSGQIDNETKQFVWTLKPGETVRFGFDDPELPHIIEWTCFTSCFPLVHGDESDLGKVDLDMIGASSFVTLFNGDKVKCEVKAENSTKVVAFTNVDKVGRHVPEKKWLSRTISIDLVGIAISVIDNTYQTKQETGMSIDILSDENKFSKEIILVTMEGWICNFVQTREGLHELEIQLDSMQADNFIFNAEYPVLFFTPKIENDPFVHCSIVRRLNDQEKTLIISYAALRILEAGIYFDTKTAETLVTFLLPFLEARKDDINIDLWLTTLTSEMSSKYSLGRRRAPRDVKKMIHNANLGRVYIETLHLHPLKLSLTFKQEWLDSNSAGTEGLIMFELIRGMASIADAPITFTSFLVGNIFESVSTLRGVILAHYSSQLTRQVLPLLFNMVILKAPLEFLSNVGSGVIRFFYEPVNALVHSPETFVQGLEVGTHHLARGVFTGFVKGAANITDLVNNNLVLLASDEVFADTRRAYQKQHDSSETRPRTIEGLLSLAGGCIVRGVQSGAAGIVEQPAMYAQRHGYGGLIKGAGIALVGAIVKPVVGVGDAAVVVMNHVSDATSENVVVLKKNKRMRRALPQMITSLGTGVNLIPFDVMTAKAQHIITGGESVDDIYLGHVTIPNYLMIASKQCLWAIDKDSRDPWCISWAEISHFSIEGGNSLTITVFSSQGPHSYVYYMSAVELAELYALLSMQKHKMGNMNSMGKITHTNLPGIKSPQAAHIFGSLNTNLKVPPSDLHSDAKLVQRCYSQVNELSSSIHDFFIRLDQEAWFLVNSSAQLFTGLSSRRCVSIGLLNGTNETIQIKSAKLIEGGSPCYIIPSKEYDKIQGTLKPGGAVIICGWGASPSFLQSGRVLINVETNLFSGDMSDRKGIETTIHSLPGYQVGFLEKSFDENGWWAKYWILVSREDDIIV